MRETRDLHFCLPPSLYPIHSNPEDLNPKLQIIDGETLTLNPKPLTLNPKP